MTKNSELDKLDEFLNKNPDTNEDEAIEIIKARKVKRVLEDEKKRLNKENRCLTPQCKGKLVDFNAEKYLIKGKKSYRLECDTCHRLHRLKVFYPDEPGLSTGEIILTAMEFAWRTNHPSKMTEDQLTIWLDEESKRIVKNKSEYIRRDEQLMLRILDMVNKKTNKILKENQNLKKQISNFKKLIKKGKEEG